jgi:hypothetical protein
MSDEAASAAHRLRERPAAPRGTLGGGISCEERGHRDVRPAALVSGGYLRTGGSRAARQTLTRREPATRMSLLARRTTTSQTDFDLEVERLSLAVDVVTREVAAFPARLGGPEARVPRPWAASVAGLS